MERVAGIEPAYSAWKAAALPLCYTRRVYLEPVGSDFRKQWWRGLDSNQRTHSDQIYSLAPLTTRPPLRENSPQLLDIQSVRNLNAAKVLFSNKKRSVTSTTICVSRPREQRHNAD